MATAKLKRRSDGSPYYLIQVSMGRGKSPMSMRWDVPQGLASKTIQSQLEKVKAEFERRCKSGEIINRAEAKAREAQAAAEAAKVLTLEQFVNGVFLPQKQNSVSRNTYLFYRNATDNHILPRLGTVKTPEITSAMIAKVLQDAQANTSLSNRSVVAIFQTLTQIFRLAFEMDVVERDPMNKVRRPRSQKDEERHTVEAFSADEVRHILDCLEKEPLKWRCYLHILIDTGLRRGECCGLRWDDVDFEKAVITIRRTICYDPEKGVYENATKTGKIRTVPVSSAVLSLLRELRMEQSEICVSKWVFAQSASGDVMHPDSPAKWLAKFGKRNNIEHLHPHKLRHSFATLGIINGADVTSMAALLGHADASTTLRIYSHADEESKLRAAQTFREAVYGTAK